MIAPARTIGNVADPHVHHEHPDLDADAEHDHDHQSHEHDRERKVTHVHGVAAEHGPSALRVVVLSSLVLGVVAAVELTAAVTSGSAAVLADGLHNLGDVSTTVALAGAFILSRRAPTRRFPYGYHRGEDLAGLVVLGSVVVFAYFFPVLTGRILPYAEWHKHMWFPRWI